MEEKYFTLEEVVEYLKIPKSTLYKLSQKGQIPSVKIGKQLRFRKSSLDKWLIEKEQGSQIPGLTTPEKKRVLLIDDDNMVLKALSRLIESAGYSVETAQNGEEALEKTRGSRFDLIVSDVRMPGIDGIETIKRIREVYHKANMPAAPEIIITGYMDSEAKRRAEGFNIHDYIHKPFAISSFLDLVKSRVEGKPSLN